MNRMDNLYSMGNSKSRNNQSPNKDLQVFFPFGYSVIGYWVLTGDWCLVIGYCIWYIGAINHEQDVEII